MKSATTNRRHPVLARLPLAAAIHFACFAPAFAAAPDDEQDQQSAPQTEAAADKHTAQQLGGITVTAQKRTENVQDVPISMDVLDTDKLQQMNVANLNDYVKLLPSVAIQKCQLTSFRL